MLPLDADLMNSELDQPGHLQVVDFAARIRVKGDKVNKLQPCALPPSAALQAHQHVEQPCRVG